MTKYNLAFYLSFSCISFCFQEVIPFHSFFYFLSFHTIYYQLLQSTFFMAECFFYDAKSTDLWA